VYVWTWYDSVFFLLWQYAILAPFLQTIKEIVKTLKLLDITLKYHHHSFLQKKHLW
jgi:hypothetical protein